MFSLLEFMGIRSPKCHNRYYVDHGYKLPIQNHTVCSLPKSDMNYIGKDNILGFDISMQDIMLMHIKNCLTYLSQFDSCLIFRKFFAQFDHFIQRTFLHIFHDNVKGSFIMEVSIHFHKIWMIQEKADFYLLDELIQHQAD